MLPSIFGGKKKRRKSKQQLDKDGKPIANLKKSQSWPVLPKAVASALGYKEDPDPDVPSVGPAENAELRKICFSFTDRKNILDLFQEMCGPDRTTVSFKTFTSYFNMKPEKWIRRTFDLINLAMTGTFSFLEFVTFVGKFLYVDRSLTEEFCFRTLSRRGALFDPHHSILDLDDFVTFVALRYTTVTKLPKQRKMALDIFASIDSDGDGGVTFEEFQLFCRQNPAFLRVTHPIQNHFRKVIFGMEFWVDKSRSIKTTRSSALELMANVGRVNRESEVYTLDHINDPVVDKRGNAIKTKQKRKKKKAGEESSQQTQQPNAQAVVDHVLKDDHESGHLEISRHQLSGIVLSEEHAGGGKGKQQKNEEDSRDKVAFFGPFSFADTVPPSTFAQDFPQLMKMRQEKRQKRHVEEMERRQKLAELNPRVYVKLVTSCSDVIYHRRAIRKGFLKWLELVQKESKAIVSAPRRHSLLTKKEFHEKESEEKKDTIAGDSVVHPEEEEDDFDDFMHRQIVDEDKARSQQNAQRAMNEYCDDYLRDAFQQPCRLHDKFDRIKQLRDQAYDNLLLFP